MPQALAAVAAVGAAIVANPGTFAAIASTVIGIGVSIATQALGKKQKARQTNVQDRTLMVKEPLVPRRVVYGRTRVGGVWVFAETSGNSNEYLHMVLAISEGPNQAIETV